MTVASTSRASPRIASGNWPRHCLPRSNRPGTEPDGGPVSAAANSSCGASCAQPLSFAHAHRTRLEENEMKFFADTAEVKDIKELHELGLLDGITTNPSLIAKSGR